MKKTLSVICVLLCCVMLFPISITAFAADTDSPITDTVVDEYVYLNRTSCNITISGITATMSASLIAKSTTSLYITMELQKIKSGVYTTIETYTASDSGTSISLNKSRLINALATYRLKVTFTAGSETVVSYAYP